MTGFRRVLFRSVSQSRYSQQQLAQLTQEWQHAQTLSQQQQHLQRQLDQAEAHLAATERLLDAPLLPVDPQSVQHAEQQLHNLQAQYQLWQDYCLAKDYQTHPHRLALTADELQQQIEQRQHHIQHLQNQHAYRDWETLQKNWNWKWRKTTKKQNMYGK